MSLSKILPLLRASMLFLAALVVTTAHAQTVQCPTSIRLQIKGIEPYAPDGAQGLIRGFGQVFSSRQVRLVGAWIGWMREGDAHPTLPLEPDDLTATLGRRSVYTLWNGSPPAPEGVLHLVCEYEAGLILNKAVGSKIRRCELTTQLQGKVGRPPTKPATNAKPSKAEAAALESQRRASADAVEFPTDSAQAQPIVTRGVVSCR